MTAPRTAEDLAGPPPTLGSSLRHLARPLAESVVIGTLVAAVIVPVVGFSYSWDHPWLYWGMASALFLLAGLPRTLPAVIEGIVSDTLSRTGIFVAIALAMVTVGALSGIGAALLATAEPLPDTLAGPLAAGLLVTAGGLWFCAWLVAMTLLVRLPPGAAVVALGCGMVMVLIAALGPLAPALLVHLGTPTMVGWVTASTLLTLPAIGLMLWAHRPFHAPTRGTTAP
ncbi:hypothetical protein [Kytococcus sedentarius]|uniref:hypothetical protein n=1 Tax=Kytococcus sedentarius TaxID=1276 RepID=UPI0035BC2570